MTTDLDKAVERLRDVLAGRDRGLVRPARSDDLRAILDGLCSAYARARAAEEGLRELVQINEQHNAAVEKVIGRPVGWRDSYLDRARSLLAKLEVRG